ncbi:MAG TPA: hypothetical protein VF898_04040 [Chloroflexota bacterium]
MGTRRKFSGLPSLAQSMLVRSRAQMKRTQSLQIAYPKDLMADAPRFSHDDVLSPNAENRVYGYYGLTRPTSAGPTGLPAESEAESPSGVRPPSTVVADEGDSAQLRKIDRDGVASTTTAPTAPGSAPETEPPTATRMGTSSSIAPDSATETATETRDRSSDITRP